MTSIRNSMALGALALAAGLVGTQVAWAQGGRSASTATGSSTQMVGLLSLGTAAPTSTITPSVLSGPLGRPPVSQPIPGPVIHN